MEKSGYTDHGLVGSVDDTFAFAPGPSASGSSSEPPRPILDLEMTPEPRHWGGSGQSRQQHICPCDEILRERPVAPAPVAGRSNLSKPTAKAIPILRQTRRSPLRRYCRTNRKKKRLFFYRGKQDAPERGASRRPIQSTIIARKASDQASAPAAATPFSSAAPVTSQTAPIPTPEPAAAMEIIPPKMLELTDRVL